jgi:hypothetical protein
MSGKLELTVKMLARPSVRPKFRRLNSNDNEAIESAS